MNVTAVVQVGPELSTQSLHSTWYVLIFQWILSIVFIINYFVFYVLKLTATIQVTLETASLGVLSGLLMAFDSTKGMRNNCSFSELETESQNCPWLYNYAGLNNYYVHFDFDSKFSHLSLLFFEYKCIILKYHVVGQHLL
jgi:hypothetical protein